MIKPVPTPAATQNYGFHKSTLLGVKNYARSTLHWSPAFEATWDKKLCEYKVYSPPSPLTQSHTARILHAAKVETLNFLGYLAFEYAFGAYSFRSFATAMSLLIIAQPLALGLIAGLYQSYESSLLLHPFATLQLLAFSIKESWQAEVNNPHSWHPITEAIRWWFQWLFPVYTLIIYLNITDHRLSYLVRDPLNTLIQNAFNGTPLLSNTPRVALIGLARGSIRHHLEHPHHNIILRNLLPELAIFTGKALMIKTDR